MIKHYESLHNHSTASDGTQTYLEALATAEAAGFGVVAFTDHDMLPSEGDLAALREYGGPVKWLIGCEMTSGLPRELGGGPAGGMFHIVGLFTDPTNVALREHCRLAQAARVERMERLVSNLQGLGFTITVADCLAASGGESVGRPHVVRALAMHPENEAVMEDLRQQMAAAAVQSAAVAMAYARMMERDKADYAYRLFLSEDAFVPGIYVDYLYSIDMDTSVRLIREAGGVALVAHFPTIARKIDAAMLEGFLREGRLDGVEPRTGYFDSDVARWERELLAMASRHDSLVTYGIDAHRPQDYERFASDRALAEKTVGRLGKLMERVKPDLRWSNL